MFFSKPGNIVQQACFALLLIAALYSRMAAAARHAVHQRLVLPASILAESRAFFCALTLLPRVQTTATVPRLALKANPMGPSRQE